MPSPGTQGHPDHEGLWAGRERIVVLLALPICEGASALEEECAGRWQHPPGAFRGGERAVKLHSHSWLQALYPESQAPATLNRPPLGTPLTPDSLTALMRLFTKVVVFKKF